MGLPFSFAVLRDYGYFCLLYLDFTEDDHCIVLLNAFHLTEHAYYSIGFCICVPNNIRLDREGEGSSRN
jgi:hypothetical protein